MKKSEIRKSTISTAGPSLQSEIRNSKSEIRSEPSPWLLVGSGLELAVLVLVFAWGGHWLDGKWGTDPWLTLTGAAIGIVGGMVHLWQVGSRFFK